jgi:hypothetical protein
MSKVGRLFEVDNVRGFIGSKVDVDKPSGASRTPPGRSNPCIEAGNFNAGSMMRSLHLMPRQGPERLFPRAAA